MSGRFRIEIESNLLVQNSKNGFLDTESRSNIVEIGRKTIAHYQNISLDEIKVMPMKDYYFSVRRFETHAEIVITANWRELSW